MKRKNVRRLSSEKEILFNNMWCKWLFYLTKPQNMVYNKCNCDLKYYFKEYYKIWQKLRWNMATKV